MNVESNCFKASGDNNRIMGAEIKLRGKDNQKSMSKTHASTKVRVRNLESCFGGRSLNTTARV